MRKERLQIDYSFLLRVKNNPKTKAVDNKTDLQIALNTAQLGRTFQDRSHVIILKPRSKLPMKFQHSNIYYINGMGKRGNIVQAYPAMEYRFYPERLTVTTEDVVCFVWSGEKDQSISYELLWPVHKFILVSISHFVFSLCPIVYLFICFYRQAQTTIRTMLEREQHVRKTRYCIFNSGFIWLKELKPEYFRWLINILLTWANNSRPSKLNLISKTLNQFLSHFRYWSHQRVLDKGRMPISQTSSVFQPSSWSSWPCRRIWCRQVKCSP